MEEARDSQTSAKQETESRTREGAKRNETDEAEEVFVACVARSPQIRHRRAKNGRASGL